MTINLIYLSHNHERNLKTLVLCNIKMSIASIWFQGHDINHDESVCVFECLCVCAENRRGTCKVVDLFPFNRFLSYYYDNVPFEWKLQNSHHKREAI